MTTKISGLLVINKPKDFTSRDVVNKVSKILQTKKVGHTGTLDPIATGVLVLTINAATKLTEIITSENKEYIASVILGVKTDTLDITGQILEKRNIIIKEQDIIDVLNSFKGSYEQTVPLYSAIRINGQKLYEYARNKEEVILPKRLVNIYDIKLLEITKNGFKFKCCVSKGTYIRSLINDIASKLNTIGVMSDLIRTKQGIFEL
ncbi:MAG: tRNA pseudouridine(55) synthase TruB, partial [Bacilli bacterium]